MMRTPLRPRLTFAALLCSALLGAVAQAQSHRLELDPERTEISFTLGATGHTVEGFVFLEAGELSFDASGRRAEGELVLAAARTNTGNKRRDRKMHEKVLLSERFPRMRFEVRRLDGSVSLDGTSTFQLHGVLELVGQSHDFSLPIEATVTGDQVEATSEFEVPYVALGLHDPSVLVLRVAKVVQVSVSARGTLRPDP